MRNSGEVVSKVFSRVIVRATGSIGLVFVFIFCASFLRAQQTTVFDALAGASGGGFVLTNADSSPTVIVSSSSLLISTSPTLATAVPNIFISSANGNVGIGTQNPTATLTVNGGVSVNALSIPNGGAVTISTMGWTLATGNCSTFTYAGAPVVDGVILSTHVLISSGVFFTNLPSTVAFTLQGLGIHLNANSSGRFVLKLATNTTGDFQSDTLQVGEGIPGSSISNAWGMGSGNGVYQSGCQVQQSASALQTTDRIKFSFGRSQPIMNEDGLPGEAAFDYSTSFTITGVTQQATEWGSCVYNSGVHGPTASSITGIGIYPPAGTQMTGWITLRRASSLNGN